MKKKKQSGFLAEAKRVCKEIVDESKMENWQYQGVIDVTCNMNFQDIASQYDLTEKEYERIIEYTQTRADKKWKREYKKLPDRDEERKVS